MTDKEQKTLENVMTDKEQKTLENVITDKEQKTSGIVMTDKVLCSFCLHRRVEYPERMRLHQPVVPLFPTKWKENLVSLKRRDESIKPYSGIHEPVNLYEHPSDSSCGEPESAKKRSQSTWRNVMPSRVLKNQFLIIGKEWMSEGCFPLPANVLHVRGRGGCI